MALTSGSSISSCASVYHLLILCRSAYERAFFSLRLITAITFEPSISLKAGPDFFSVTSPQPINPHFNSFIFLMLTIFIVEVFFS